MARIDRRQLEKGELGEVVSEVPVVVVRPDGMIRFYMLHDVDLEHNGEKVHVQVIQPEMERRWALEWEKAEKAKGRKQ